jgi:hypothetical protein
MHSIHDRISKAVEHMIPKTSNKTTITSELAWRELFTPSSASTPSVRMACLVATSFVSWPWSTIISASLQHFQPSSTFEGSDDTINHSNDYSLGVIYHFVDIENTDRMSPRLMILAKDITRRTLYYNFSASWKNVIFTHNFLAVYHEYGQLHMLLCFKCIVFKA